MKRTAAKICVIMLAFTLMVLMMPLALHLSASAADNTATEITATADRDETGPYILVKWVPHGGESYHVYKIVGDGEPTLVTNNLVRNSYEDRAADLQSGTEYSYLIVYVNSGTEELGQSDYVTITPSFPEPEASSGDSGNAGGSSDSGSSDNSGSSSGSGSSGSSSGSSSNTYGVEKPELSDVTVTFSSSAAGSIDITYINHGSDPHSVYGVQVKRGSKTILNADSNYASKTKSVAVPYGKTVTFKYRVYRARIVNSRESDRVYSSSWKTVKKRCATLKKPTLSVTKISRSKAGLAWNRVPGATGYKVYCGSKLVKTIKKGSTTNYIYSKAGAGSKAYRVRAVIKNSKMTKAYTGGYSKAKKGKDNYFTDSYYKKVSSLKYANAKFDVAKVSLSGNTYTLSGYVLNNRIFDLVKFQNMKVTIYCNGKKVASKNFRNLSCYVSAGGSKRFSIKIKGKGGVDIRNGGKFTITDVDPYWKGVGASK